MIVQFWISHYIGLMTPVLKLTVVFSSYYNLFHPFVTVPSRIAQIKKSTVPGLELSCIITNGNYVYCFSPIFNSKEVSCWTDPTLVLHRIKNTRKIYHPFIQNANKKFEVFLTYSTGPSF